MNMNKKLICAILVTTLLFPLVVYLPNISAWSNGGYSSDSFNPDYGTHDWIAEHALDWLPIAEKQYILDNLATYLYGTELPDNNQAPDGIGDTVKHHIYFNSSGIMVDDSAAVRAQEEYDNVLYYLSIDEKEDASKHAGMMSHYIVDVAVFGHVMGKETDWGSEQHHKDYESYVKERTSSYDDEFNSYLSFDGNLTSISAYNATKNIAHDTTFDEDGDLTCIWMDENYNWSNPIFRDRCGESLNLAANILADVLHTVYIQVIPEFPKGIMLPLFIVMTLTVILFIRKRAHKTKASSERRPKKTM